MPVAHLQSLSLSLKKYVSTIDPGSAGIFFLLQALYSLFANKDALSQISHKQE